MIVIGVDIGFTGGISVIDACKNKIIEMIPMPVCEKWIDVDKIYNILYNYKEKYKENIIIIIEKQQRNPSSIGQEGAFFAISKLTIKDVYSVHPTKWQSEMALKKDNKYKKEFGYNYICDEYKSFKSKIPSKTKNKYTFHDGCVDAALIAIWYIQHGYKENTTEVDD